MNNYFSFKQFTVWQDKTTMKVGTDGVLIGTLAANPRYSSSPSFSPKNILDIGTGTGLVALILAQRFANANSILGIDIDPDATAQAQENFNNSPWHNRLSASCLDVVSFLSDTPFDLIVCNPPYFNNSLKSPDNQRSVARHTVSLDYLSLARSVERLLAPDGLFVVILPTDCFSSFESLALDAGLYCSAMTNVFPTPEKPSKRIVAEFSKANHNTAKKIYYLTIEESRHVYTPDFKLLTSDFYLERK